MPTNTKEMNYSKKYHMYILNYTYLQSEFGIDFVEKEGSDTKAKDMMYKISRTVYEYIYLHSQYKKQMEYWLALDETLRPIILRALEEQARYEFETSAEYFSIQNGINLVNGMQIPLDRMRGMVRIAPSTETILRNNKLLYQGQRFMVKTDMDYEKDEY